jgi:hypothetical protein
MLSSVLQGVWIRMTACRMLTGTLSTGTLSTWMQWPLYTEQVLKAVPAKRHGWHRKPSNLQDSSSRNKMLLELCQKHWRLRLLIMLMKTWAEQR